MPNPDPRIPPTGMEPSPHARDAASVLEDLDTSLEGGLADDEVERRRAEHGPNELPADEGRGNLQILVAQFTSPLIFILLVAGVVTLLIEEYTDAAVIAAVLVINATIGFIQERGAERSVLALMELASPTTTVVREGRRQDVDGRALVPGDIVRLTSGSLVPADLRLVTAQTLDVDESLLTGESEPTRKQTTPVAADALAADRTCMAHMGSAVASGRGVGVVVATGQHTELGRIASSIRDEERPATPLQRRMHRFANIIAGVVLASTLVAFLLGLALGGDLDEMFLTAVALAVAVVPEGLPVAFTVAMALGVRRMARRNAIVRSLPAVETLGSTNTIGSDKTGTLTENRMTVRQVWLPDGTRQRVGDPAEDHADGLAHATADEVRQAPQGPLARLLRASVLSNEGQLTHTAEGIEHHGDPTETALLAAAHHLGVDPQDVRADTDVLHELPFESERRYSATVVDEDGPVVHVKGAPERVVELASAMLTADGAVDLDRDAVLAAAASMAEAGLRVLATAEGRLNEVPGPDEVREPDALVLTGLVGMQDPPRPGVRDSIAACRSAGIAVVMITGDHAVTALAIARDLGITEGDDPACVTGAEVEQFDDDELLQRVRNVRVFARVAPDHKLRIVRALQHLGDVVAVTGDGVNDGPALKAADIGVAMGRDGTDVAREAADMVLTDDNFTSIVGAVEEGRVVFDNVRKVTYFLLSTGAASIVAIVTSIAAGLPLPYVPAALLWLNVVTNGLQDVALAFEPGEPDVLEHPPRARDDGIVSTVLWERTALLGIAMALGSLWLFTWAIDAGLSEDQQRGAALTTLVVAMAVHAGNARSERRSLFRMDPRGNPFLAVAVVLAVGVHLGALHWGPTQEVLQVAPVPGAAWLRIGVVAVAVVALSEVHKRLRSPPL